jgi:hypothetical protein
MQPLEFGHKTLKLVAGACFEATKTHVVCLSLERILEPMTIPEICGNGHLLTPDHARKPEGGPSETALALPPLWSGASGRVSGAA